MWQQEWHFFTSTWSITSFITSWFLWGLRDSYRKHLPRKNPYYATSSQWSVCGLNLKYWHPCHTQCISNNLGAKKPNQEQQKKKYASVLCTRIKKKNPWEWIINAVAWITPVLCQRFQRFVTRYKKQESSTMISLWKDRKPYYNTRKTPHWFWFWYWKEREGNFLI